MDRVRFLQKIALAASVSLAMAFSLSFSQENEDKLKFGARLGFNFNMADRVSADLGMGYGGGLKASIPIMKSPFITFNPEVNFFYRSICSWEVLGAELKWTEFAIGIPLVFQYVPVESKPFYVGLGVQLDIPLAAEIKTDFKSEAYEKLYGWGETHKVKDRNIPDIGFVVEAGWHLTKNINADARYVWGFTNLSKEYGYKFSFDQIGVGLSYFF